MHLHKALAVCAACFAAWACALAAQRPAPAPELAAQAPHGSAGHDEPRAGWQAWYGPYPAAPHRGRNGLVRTSCCDVAPPANTAPEPALTPGAVRPLTEAQVCGIRWGRDERHVTAAMKREVFKAYGFSGYRDPRCIPDQHHRTCEIDHLISRELGGADDPANLWPEPYGGPWNAHDKDRLENRLHVEVCDLHTLTLDQAQALVRSDWRSAYRARFGEPQSAVTLSQT